MLEGQNVCVIDVETLHSAQECRHCGKAKEDHANIVAEFVDAPKPIWYCGQGNTVYEAIGWDNHIALGLSIGCLYRYDTDRYQFFDVHTLEDTMSWLVEAQPLLVSFNGIRFDFPLLYGLLNAKAEALQTELGFASDRCLSLWNICCVFKTQYLVSYDILAEIWQADPDDKFKPGLNSLDAISVANGYGRKEMDGVTAPRRWKAGKIANVVNYNMGDVWKTRKLFEQIMITGIILRGDLKPIALPRSCDWLDDWHVIA